MNLLQLIETIIGVGEEVIPIFIHNPKSQKIEGIVIGTVNGILSGLAPAAPATPATPAAPPNPAT
jgi:hypothetical protein